MSEIVVDNFAGGGGASTGIEMAIGRSVDIAINHDPAAIAMHRANHPTTEHYQEDVWKVNPVKVCAGRPVALAWFSPDCKHHSRAKGGKPVSRHIRGLAWVAVKWAKAVHPRVIMLENVEEFQDWGRLDKDNRPDPRYKGETFRRFVSQLERQGYKVEYRMMRACDYGAPTIRKRFFLIARCDGKPIIWPEPTHAAPDSFEALAGMKKPWVPVADVLDFNLPCPSIFATSEEIFKQYGIHAVRPLSEKTMRRIARGIEKFVLKNPSPFIIQVNHGGENFRGQDIEEPLDTITARHGTGVVMPMMIQYHDEQGGEVRGQAGILPLNNDRFWYGTTCENPMQEYFFCGKAKTFVSIEPIFAPFTGLNYFDTPPEQRVDWIIVGAETGNRKGKIIPEKSWIDELAYCSAQQKTPIFMKSSLRGIMGVDFVQQFPWDK